jgi:hypothetical protein
METYGDALIVTETVAAGRGPLASLYASRWEDPRPERGHALRARLARSMTRLATALTATETRTAQRQQSLADGAAR